MQCDIFSVFVSAQPTRMVLEAYHCFGNVFISILSM